MAKVTAARVEELKRRAMERAPRRDGCVCQYVDVVEGEPLSDEVRKRVEANVLCFGRHKHTRSHVGFSTVIIAPQRPPLADAEDDDAPLVA
jgi:hypothetical protein